MSVCLCLSLAVFYLLTAPKLYTRYAAIIVNEQTQGSNSKESGSEFEQLGFVKQSNNMENTLRYISSLDVLMDVALRLDSTLKGDRVMFAALDIQGSLTLDVGDVKSTVIDMTYKAPSISEAENTLMLIVQVFNEKNLVRRQKMTNMTSKFIDARLELLEKDLDIVDDSIATYKSRYGITDLTHVSDIYLQQQSQSDAQILALSNQKNMAKYVRDLLTDKESHHQLLIANSGMNNAVIESQITIYNNLLLQLQSHLEYTSGQNPLIVNKEKELDHLRKNILANINNHIHTLDIQLQALQSYHGEAMSKISSNPSQAKYLESIDREKKVKESLYLYLLQKKEENEISVTYQPESAYIIDIPNGNYKPSYPKKTKTLFAALFLGLLLPVTFLFLRASFDENVRDRHDIEQHTDIPFLGEVPYSGREHSVENLLMRFGLGKKHKSSGIVVGHDKLDASNESFRILRNNMEAIRVNKSLGNSSRVYLIKSTEIEVGKTFVAMNLALTKAIAGMRVLFIDGDLRQASASRLWRTPLSGLTDYLHGEVDDYHSLLQHPHDYATLSVLPAGALPTNPTELLRNPLFGHLLDQARQEFDSIIIDSPSAGMLADADIIESLVDCTLFVVRAGRFNRHRLDELSPIYSRDTIKPQYVILNGVSINVRYGYAYLHKYERTESDKQETEISKRTILLNKIIFKKKRHKA